MEIPNNAFYLFQEFSQSGFTIDELNDIELKLFKSLNWNLNLVTFSDLLDAIKEYCDKELGISNMDDFEVAINEFYFHSIKCNR